ncbi:MAG: lysophospholipid acyltransferase family protein, partial [Stellaceae bacterium]
MTDGGFLLRVWRAGLYFLVTLLAGPVQAALLLTKSPLARRFPRFYHRLCCRILGFRIERIGATSPNHPTLYVA